MEHNRSRATHIHKDESHYNDTLLLHDGKRWLWLHSGWGTWEILNEHYVETHQHNFKGLAVGKT